MIKITSAYVVKNNNAEVFLLVEQSNFKNKSVLTIADRIFLSTNCVTDTISFDENEIVLSTEQGILLIMGNGLHIKKLSLETGEVEIEGKIDLLEYKDKTVSENRKFFKRHKNN